MRKANVFWQAQPLIDGLNSASLQHWNPAQKLGGDEKCTPFKGRCSATQYNPSKPGAKWHLKDFVIAESDTGFVLYFFPYQGNDHKRPADMTLAEYSLRELLSSRYPTKVDYKLSNKVIINILYTLCLGFVGRITFSHVIIGLDVGQRPNILMKMIYIIS